MIEKYLLFRRKVLKDKELKHLFNLKDYITIDEVTYNEFTKNTYKCQFQEHHNSLKYQEKENSTELSNNI